MLDGPYRILAFVVLVTLAVAGIGVATHRFLEYERGIGYDRAKAEYTAKALKDQQEATAKIEAITAQLQKAQNDATRREQTFKTLAVAAATAGDSLRDTLQSIKSGAGQADLAACRITAAATATVFDQCQAAYRGMAEVADRHASDSKTLLDSWPAN